MVLIAAALGLQYRSALDQIAAIEWELLAAAQAQKRNIFQIRSLVNVSNFTTRMDRSLLNVI